ncbi:NADH dehydrogenase [ubiquinone] 1 alpha subcomplex assembly factor 2 [Geodia barretti]|uniref:NADH dehydrogenase [ubiquinone] 1 alpha subcomplex assembly factor 2 n=1 Tax=Geodia barretti TaxID=519541 RepID=A0AA35R2M6_GEOBA|nr:NADH dehydrogenase [ubiquinone] 1 alpha subcomplex assembly factor 2 [Geodia barretti]
MSSWLGRLRGVLGLKSRVRVVGTDLNGNKYIEAQPRGDSGRLRRTVKMVGVSTDQYTEDAIPHEWEQWLRGSRQDPPTHEVL